MKRSFVAAAALATVVTGSAMAADMRTKAPTSRAVSDWTGFYIGFHGGYGWGRPGIADLDLNDSNPNVFETTPLHAPNLKGSVFGGHVGYNWQWGQRGVVGLEIDYSAARIQRTQVADGPGDIIGPLPRDDDPFPVPEHIDTRTLKSKLDRLASARARVGFLVGPEFLLYGTGGVAWGHTSFTDTFVARFPNPDRPDDVTTIVSRASTNHLGWVAGAGTEWKLWDSGLILRVEYLHYDFSSTSLAFDATRDGNSKRDSFNMHLGKLTTDVVRGGISYKF
jgi:outer membrane immunogenic protein